MELRKATHEDYKQVWYANCKCGYSQYISGKKPILRYVNKKWRIECPRCNKGTAWCKTLEKAKAMFNR